MKQLFIILLLLQSMINMTVANKDPLSSEFIKEINRKAKTWKV